LGCCSCLGPGRASGAQYRGSSCCKLHCLCCSCIRRGLRARHLPSISH
jgi:hypothetical protein